MTAPLPKKNNQSPAERALWQKFAITSNVSVQSSLFYRSATNPPTVMGGSGGLGLEAARALLEHGVQGLAIFDLASALDGSKVALQALHDEFPSVKKKST